jgi:uncharacterized membrane protein
VRRRPQPVAAATPDACIEVKKYLIAGLLVWLPLAITIWVLLWLLGVLDGVFQAAAGHRPRPCCRKAASLLEQPAPHSRPGRAAGGWCCWAPAFVTNIFGQWWLQAVGPPAAAIPIVKSIYSSVKQVSDTLFSSSGKAFREAVLVQYPRQGCLDHRLRHRQAPVARWPATCRASMSASTCRPRPTRPRASS